MIVGKPSGPMEPPPFDTTPLVPGTQVLRQKAEAQWQAINLKAANTLGHLSVRDTTALIHELQVHQIELEMQNDELRRTHDDLDLSRNRYIDLYELAPVGYCGVSHDGLLVQSNLTLAILRRELLKRPFTRFVSRPDQLVWHRLHNKLMESGAPHTGELRMRKGLGLGVTPGDDHLVWVHLAVTFARDEAGQQMIQIAVR